MNEQFESKVAKKEAEHAKVLESLEIEKQNQQEVFNLREAELNGKIDELNDMIA